MQFKISAPFVDQRLDIFLTKKFPQLSRSNIQKAIIEKEVLINGKAVAKHYFLKLNDLVTWEQVLVSKKPEVAAIKLQPTVAIIFEDENYLVVNKPAGLIVHPSALHTAPDTLVDWLLAYYPEIAKIGEDAARPGIVHRLDKDVSGLMVIAKTPAAFSDLKQQFSGREIYKEYAALVYGKFSQASGEINFSISRSTRQGNKMAAHPDASGKEARTEYTVEQEFQNYSLLKVIIHTGRTHQIRVHFNALNHPLVGDHVYQPKKFKSRVNLARIFLHAQKLSFNNLQGEKLEFTAPLPPELQAFLANLK